MSEEIAPPVDLLIDDNAFDDDYNEQTTTTNDDNKNIEAESIDSMDVVLDNFLTEPKLPQEEPPQESQSQSQPQPQPEPEPQPDDVSSYAGSDLTPEEEMYKKKQLLLKLKRYEKKGFQLSRNYSLDSNLIDIQAEYESLRTEANLNTWVQAMKQGVGVGTYFVEILNNKFDPVNAELGGWSNQVKMDISDGMYDEVLEELYDKYNGKFKMPPELRLISILGTSALQYHIAQKIVNHTLTANKTEEILRNNPKLKKDILSAANNTKMKVNADVESIMREIE